MSNKVLNALYFSDNLLYLNWKIFLCNCFEYLKINKPFLVVEIMVHINQNDYGYHDLFRKYIIVCMGTTCGFWDQYREWVCLLHQRIALLKLSLISQNNDKNGIFLIDSERYLYVPQRMNLCPSSLNAKHLVSFSTLWLLQ